MSKLQRYNPDERVGFYPNKDGEWVSWKEHSAEKTKLVDIIFARNTEITLLKHQKFKQERVISLVTEIIEEYNE